YRARVDHTSISSQPPAGSPTVWERVNNNDGTWQTQIIYAVGDRVLYQGNLYVALQQHQAQQNLAPATTPSLWNPFPATACAQLATLCQGESDPGASSCHDLGTAGDDAACTSSFSDCLAACADNGGGPHEAADPCSGLCAPATVFKVPDGATFSGNLGTGAACFETNAQIATGTCTNGRQVTVNGVTVPCDGKTNWKLPTERNHGYCVQAAAGNSSSFTVHH
ncbi:MAG TPA: carbohydrate-binding protein, partial [Polyangiaceae bacterium]|nr:carbohydrate-binding protein [Polyangiaceae bacterium]